MPTERRSSSSGTSAGSAGWRRRRSICDSTPPRLVECVHSLVAAAYLASWSAQRSVDGTGVPGLGSLLGSAGLRALGRRLNRRLAGAVPTAAPLMLGAAIAGRVNRRATESLAGRVLDDLRAPRPGGAGS